MTRNLLIDLLMRTREILRGTGEIVKQLPGGPFAEGSSRWLVQKTLRSFPEAIPLWGGLFRKDLSSVWRS
jgi:hypothetical protein